jgi:hypothetical protein
MVVGAADFSLPFLPAYKPGGVLPSACTVLAKCLHKHSNIPYNLNLPAHSGVTGFFAGVKLVEKIRKNQAKTAQNPGGKSGVLTASNVLI